MELTQEQSRRVEEIAQTLLARMPSNPSLRFERFDGNKAIFSMWSKDAFLGEVFHTTMGVEQCVTN